jgi:Photosynthetic reaction centre cytochrome C subunit
MRLFATMLFLIPLCAQQAPEGGRQGMAPQAPKNLKVLKIQPSEIRAIMRSYTASLGVHCEFCHVEGNFASDENSKKETARMMIVMVQGVNAKFPDGKEHVTCYTCHRGATEPATVPPAPAAPPPDR